MSLFRKKQAISYSKTTEDLFSKEITLSPAETAYTASVEKGKKRFKWAVFFLTVLELTVMGCLAFVINQNNLLKRVNREHEIRSTGEIKLKTGAFSGDTDFGYFFGNGIFDFNTGSIYNGEWNNNIISGKGELQVPTEGTYDGEFEDFQKNGEGTFTWEDGSVYDGEWKDDEMTGSGDYICADGTVYSGSFKENTFVSGSCDFENSTGEYHLTYSNGKISDAEIEFNDGTKYEGDCTEETIAGIGEMVFVSEDVYSGSFEDGKRDGSGEYNWESGDIYNGEWAEDKMSGSGKYSFADGNILQGTFEDNSFTDGSFYVTNDFGEYTFTISEGDPVEVDMVLADGTEYSGEMDDQGLNGTAQIEYSNGDKYDGEVSDGEKSGKGVYTWASGAKYDGQWENDQMSGKGTYYYPNGEEGYKIVGSFENGVPVGDCDYYTDKSTHYQTTWEDGKCVKVTE